MEPAVGADGPPAGLAPASAVKLWRKIAAIPVPCRGLLSAVPGDEGALHGTVAFEAPDLDGNKKAAFQRSFFVDAAAGTATELPLSSGVVDAAQGVVRHSPSRQRYVRFVPAGTKGGAARLELWTHAGMLCSTPVHKVHGQVPGDAQVQNVQWSADETKVVYAAETLARGRERKHLWDEGNEAGGGANAGPRRGAFENVDTWGEEYLAFSTISLYEADFSAAAPAVRCLVPDAFTQHQSCTMPVLIDEDVLFVTYPHAPVRPGIAYYNARPNELWVLRGRAGRECMPHHPQLVDLSAHGVRNVSAMVRRPTTREALLVTAVNTAVHASGSDMWLYDVDSGAMRAVLRTPRQAPAAPGAFPGIFSFTATAELFFPDPDTVVMSSLRRSAVALYRLGVGEGDPATAPEDLWEISSGADAGSHTQGTWKVLDVARRAGVVVVLAARGGTTARPRVTLLCLGAAKPGVRSIDLFAKDAALEWADALCSRYCTSLDAFPQHHNTEVLRHTRRARAGAARRAPTIVVLHGGPHAADTNAFSHQLLFYLAAGFELLSVNYGGSLGFGQSSLEGLPGHIGRRDVEDVMAVLYDLGYVNRATGEGNGCLFVYGGSHGGFLSAHLTGQYPRAFSAASLRNPVICLLSNLDLSDIPDWTLAEAGVAGRDPEALCRTSPMQYVNAVRAPTLVALGLKDHRVPPSQGRAWYRALKRSEHAVDARLLLYPDDGHPLTGVHAQADYALQTALFFAGALGGRPEDLAGTAPALLPEEL
eukprot:TRINITY_DN7319_c0_g1_i1.p1 TRINITY_DN7319_c0_g1~~TRINITY_DN7319_c0_g1_i1.p1  ORF type:complete len:762 (+),score=179.62 TRINITY_DN7319_c0_g1_i1:100-2385(+)